MNLLKLVLPDVHDKWTGDWKVDSHVLESRLLLKFTDMILQITDTSQVLLSFYDVYKQMFSKCCVNSCVCCLTTTRTVLEGQICRLLATLLCLTSSHLSLLRSAFSALSMVDPVERIHWISLINYVVLTFDATNRLLIAFQCKTEVQYVVQGRLTERDLQCLAWKPSSLFWTFSTIEVPSVWAALHAWDNLIPFKQFPVCAAWVKRLHRMLDQRFARLNRKGWRPRVHVHRTVDLVKMEAYPTTIQMMDDANDNDSDTTMSLSDLEPEAEDNEKKDTKPHLLTVVPIPACEPWKTADDVLDAWSNLVMLLETQVPIVFQE